MLKTTILYNIVEYLLVKRVVPPQSSQEKSSSKPQLGKPLSHQFRKRGVQTIILPTEMVKEIIICLHGSKGEKGEWQILKADQVEI